MRASPRNHRLNAGCGSRARRSRTLGSHARRAFTLLELLFVIGVLLVIAAIAYPLYAPMLDRQEFDTAVESAVAQCQQARASAQSRGVAVEVVVLDGGTRLEARTVDLLSDADDGPARDGIFNADGMDAGLRGSAGGQRKAAEMKQAIARAGNAAMGAGGAGFEGSQSAALDAVIGQLTLSQNITASVQRPQHSAERAEFNDAIEGRVALFLPDGSATAVRGFWLMTGMRAARVDIDPLLGHATRREVSAGAVRGSGDAGARDGGDADGDADYDADAWPDSTRGGE